MDDTTPFDDHSGYAVNGIQQGTALPNSISLVAGAKFSQVFGPTSNAQFPTPIFQKGQESRSFTLELWFRLITPGAAQRVLSNNGLNDGIVITGNTIQFITKYANTDDAVISYDIQQGRTVHIVAVHSASKNSLFINGVLVGEVNLTEAQIASPAAGTPNGNLYSGGAGTQKFALNGVALYATALAQESILRHYQAGTDTLSAEQVVASFGGVKIPMSLSNSSLFLDQWWTSEEHWKAASLFNVSVIDGALRPQFDGTTSIPGQWLDSFALEAAEGTSVFGVSANWDGVGIVIEVSLDGATWETVQRGRNIAMIPPGFNPTGKELQIRVSFAGGILEDPAFLDNLNFVGINTGVTPAVDGRTVTFNNAFQEREYPPMALHDNWGAEIASGGSITISPDALEATPIRTIEVWMKPLVDTTAVTFGTAFIAGYQNGIVGTTTLRGEEWVVYHRVISDYTNPLVIAVPGQVGQVVLYPTALTAAEVAKIYGQYTNSDILLVNDSSSWPVTQTSPAARVYGFDWSIKSAG